MAHLAPEQFVDIADGVLAESARDVAPHLAACAACRQQLADVRAMMAEAVDVEVPEPSPLFWEQLSSGVRAAVAEEPPPRRAWREWLLQPKVWAPSLAAAVTIVLLFVVQPRESLTPATIPSTPLPIGGRAGLPSLEPSSPLGASDDPQLGLVADYGTTLSWDEMRDEMALSDSSGSSDAVLDVLTVDEQRELQRLLAEEMSQPAVPENRS